MTLIKLKLHVLSNPQASFKYGLMLILISTCFIASSCFQKERSPSNENVETGQEIVYDLFEINYHLNGNQLQFSLSSDIPKKTPVIIWITRSYWRNGEHSKYATFYFHDEGSLDKYLSPNTLVLDNKQWINELLDTKDEMATGESAFEIDRISDSIDIWATVPYVDDSYPNFANDSLGEKEVSFYHPLSQK